MLCDRCDRYKPTVIVERGYFPCDERCGCVLRRGHRVVTYLCAVCAKLATRPA